MHLVSCNPRSGHGDGSGNCEANKNSLLREEPQYQAKLASAAIKNSFSISPSH